MVLVDYIGIFFLHFRIRLRDNSNSKTRLRFVYMKNLKKLNESSPQLE
jgi:hypothetical protein